MQDGVNSPVANDAAADAAGEGHERAQAELIDSVLDGQGGAPSADGEQGEQITSPTKLIRIATMVRTMLDEVRRAPLDDAGRRMLKEIHEKSLHELEGVLSPDLRQELSEVVFPFTSDEPTDSELRIAQAQLVGWLEGLFHGIQATLFTQQAMAQGQIEEMRRRRAIEPGAMGCPCRAGRAGTCEHHRGRRARRRLALPPPDWSPGSWREHDAAQQPDWPDAARARRRARRAARGAAARVRRRGPQPHRHARRASAIDAASCSRRATARSRSTCSRPTRSATSSRSSCRWQWCSPTGAASPP